MYMLKNLNKYEKVYVFTPLLTVLLVMLVVTERYVVRFEFINLVLTIVANTIFIIVAIGYIYAFFVRYRYAKILKSPFLKSEDTTWRERRLYDFCILSALVSFFAMIALSVS